jgi:hypothetical protein
MSGKRQVLTEVQAEGALKGSLAQTICNQAWDYYQENNGWPDANYLARHAGLSIYNRNAKNNFAVYILERPYHELPSTMNPSQTFAFYSFGAQPDSGAYVYCRVRYNKLVPDRNFECSIVEGDHAARHSMKLESEKDLIDFLAEADSIAQCGSSLDKAVTKYALHISETSPNPTAKQALFEFAYDLLHEYYTAIHESADDQFSLIFHAQSRCLGNYIHAQDWRH